MEEAGFTNLFLTANQPTLYHIPQSRSLKMISFSPLLASQLRGPTSYLADENREVFLKG
jgi:hypothetical protein